MKYLVSSLSIAILTGLFLIASAHANQWSAERVVVKSAATMVNNQVAFTITGGPIRIIEIYSVCITSNDATASTLQWRSNPTVGTANTISAATGSLQSKTAGNSIRLTPTLLTTQPVLSPDDGGVQAGVAAMTGIIVKAGTIQMVIGVGSTTGTWTHYLRYQPLDPAVIVN